MHHLHQRTTNIVGVDTRQASATCRTIFTILLLLRQKIFNGEIHVIAASFKGCDFDTW